MFDSRDGQSPEPLAQARAAAHAQVDAAFDTAVSRAADDADGPRRDLAAAVAGSIAWAVLSQRGPPRLRRPRWTCSVWEAATGDNLILLCPRHHLAVHDGRWTPVLHPDATVEISRGRTTLRSTPRTTTGIDLHRLPNADPADPPAPTSPDHPHPPLIRPTRRRGGRPPDTPF